MNNAKEMQTAAEITAHAARCWSMVLWLSEHEGESVRIVHPNPDFDGPDVCIEYQWGADEDQSQDFFGYDYEHCLQQALAFKHDQHQQAGDVP